MSEWQDISTAPKDGTPFIAIKWWRDYASPDPHAGYWGTPERYAFATNPRDEQCWHSSSRQTCIRDTTYNNGSRELDAWRWIALPPLPEPPK